MSKVNMSEIQASDADLTPQGSLHWLAAAMIVFLTILATSWGNRLYLGQEVFVDYSDIVIPLVFLALLIPYVVCVRFFETFDWPGRTSLEALREQMRENPQLDSLVYTHPEEGVEDSVINGRDKILSKIGLALWCTDPNGKKWLMLLLGGVALFCLEMAFTTQSPNPGLLTLIVLAGAVAVLGGAFMWLATGYRSLRTTNFNRRSN